MNTTDTFLDSYKRLEAALAQSGLTPLTYENLLADHSEKQDKLKTCRIIRNYLAHHPDGSDIFPATKEMAQFVTELAEEEEKKFTTLKDLAVKTMVANSQTTLKELVEEFARISKKKNVKCDGKELVIPYEYDPKLVYMIPERYVFIQLSEGKTIRHKVDELSVQRMHCPWKIRGAYLSASELDNLNVPVIVVKSLSESLNNRNYVGMIWK